MTGNGHERRADGRTALVVGAGLAGAVAARSLADHGWDVLLVERGETPGGTTVLSSGWIWRYRDLETFAWGAPRGDRVLQKALWKALPAELEWLGKRGVRTIARSTANPLTDGIRVDPAQMIEVLLRGLPQGTLRTERELRRLEGAPDGSGAVVATIGRSDDFGGGAVGGSFEERWEVDAVVLAGGGYAADVRQLAAELGVDRQLARWTARNSGLSDGSAQQAAVDGLDAALTPSAGSGELYARPMAAVPRPTRADWVRQSQVYGRWARLVWADGSVYRRSEHDWADALLATQIARREQLAWLVLDREALLRPTPYGLVKRAVQDAEAGGAAVVHAPAGQMADALAELGAADGPALRAATADAVSAVPVIAGITHTVRGLRVDEGARITGPEGAQGVRSRVYAAGIDAGGVADGGYASGLAQALVLGRIAASSAQADCPKR